MDWGWSLLEALRSRPYADGLVGIALLLAAAGIMYIVVRRVVLRLVHAATEHTHWKWDDAVYDSGAFRQFAKMTAPLIMLFGIELVPDVSVKSTEVISRIALAFTIFYLLRGINASLNGLQTLAVRNPNAQVPVKGYLQLLKIVIAVIGCIVVVAILIDRSPLILLSGLGAASALMLLIFKDTLLGFVASVQIGSNDMLRIGDWIEMPSANADGEVMDITLHTVKVRNWDSTISTIPTWRLITESFKNWRGMFDSGGRRIKRSLFINAATVKFLSDEEIESLRSIGLLQDYLAQKQQEVGQWNEALGEKGRVAANQRRLTNLGTFRAYAEAYLKASPDIHHGMTCMVRQMASEGDGIPLELYCFTSNTGWVKYETVQSDIFDHLFSILPTFGLSLYQRPAGTDFREAWRGTRPESVD
ncbi:MAG: mechanosensitive ion channel family protein [Moraxellaceae bacterium]